LRRRRRGPVRTGLLGQRRVDPPFFSNPDIERALGDEPFRATGNDVLFLFNMIELAPFTDGFPATRQSLCDQVFIGLAEREKGGNRVRAGVRTLRRTGFELVCLFVHGC
jgi:hypothetical protein